MIRTGLDSVWRGKWMLLLATVLAAGVAWAVDAVRNGGRHVARASVRIAVLDAKPLVPPEEVEADLEGAAPPGTRVRAARAGHWNVVAVELDAGDPGSATRSLTAVCRDLVEKHARFMEAAVKDGERYERDLVAAIDRLLSEGKADQTPPLEEKLLGYRVKRDELVSEPTRVLEEAHLAGRSEPAMKAASVTAILGLALLFLGGASVSRCGGSER